MEKRRLYKGDIVEITDVGIFNVKIKKGDVAEAIGSTNILMLTGDCAGMTQATGGFDNVRVLRPVELPFTPFTLEFSNREEAELLKAIMHLHNKVADSSFFDLYWTPKGEDVRQFMKNTYERIDENCPGWENYNK